MDNALQERALQLKEFFSLKPSEWARRAGADGQGGSADYPQAVVQKQSEARDVARQLVQAGDQELLRNVLKDAPSDLLVPVGQELAAEAYAPAEPWLLREYKGASPEAKKAVLGFLAAAGSLLAYPLLSEVAASKDEALKKAATEAEHGLLARHPSLSWVATLARGGRPEGTEFPEGAEIKRYMLETLSLSEAVSALESMAQFFPFLAEQVKGQLLEERKSGKTRSRAMLLLASGSPMQAPVKETVRAVGSASRDDRLLVLSRSAGPFLLGELLNSGTPKNVSAALTHLEGDLPGAVPRLTTQLLNTTRRQQGVLAARAATLVLEHAPLDEQPRLITLMLAVLETQGSRSVQDAILKKLLGLAEGIDALVKTHLSGSAWSVIGELFKQGSIPQESRDAFFRSVAETLGAAAVWDLPRLNWALSMLSAGYISGQDSLGGIERAVAAQLSSAPTEVSEPLSAFLINNARLAPILKRVLPRLVPNPEKLKDVLQGFSPGISTVLATVEAGVREVANAVQGLADLTAESYGDSPDETTRWLQGSTQSAELGILLGAQAELNRLRITQLAQQSIEEEELDRQAAAEKVGRLLDILSAELEGVGRAGDSAGELEVYLEEIADASLSALEQPYAPPPIAPPATGDILNDLVQTRITLGALTESFQHRGTELRTRIVAAAGLGIEKLMIALRGLPAQDVVVSAISQWLAEMGFSAVERDLGALVIFSPDKHQDLQGGELEGLVEVVTFGICTRDGIVVRPAVVTKNKQA